jgi:hypothetical protein
LPKFPALPKAASMACATAPVGAPPPPGFMLFQKNVWFQICAALLNTPPLDLRTMSSSGRLSNSVPGISLFRLSTSVL